jgi:hypothetical protein
LKGRGNSEDLGIDGSWSKYSGRKRSIDPCVNVWYCPKEAEENTETFYLMKQITRTLHLIRKKIEVTENKQGQDLYSHESRKYD